MIVAKPILREKETSNELSANDVKLKSIMGFPLESNINASNVILEPLCEAAHYCMALNCRIITGILG